MYTPQSKRGSHSPLPRRPTTLPEIWTRRAPSRGEVDIVHVAQQQLSSKRKIRDAIKRVNEVVSSFHNEELPTPERNFGFGMSVHALAQVESSATKRLTYVDGGKQVNELKHMIDVFLVDIETKDKEIQRLRTKLSGTDLDPKQSAVLAAVQQENEALHAQINELRARIKRLEVPLRRVQEGDLIDSSDEDNDEEGKPPSPALIFGETEPVTQVEPHLDEATAAALADAPMITLEVTPSVGTEVTDTQIRPMTTSTFSEDTVVRRTLVQAAPSGDVTLLFTEIEASNRLWEYNHSAMRQSLQQYTSIIRRSIYIHNGYEVRTHGDVFFVAFVLPEDAVRFALYIQEALMAEEWPAKIVLAPEAQPECRLQDGVETRILNGVRVRIVVHRALPVTELNPVTGKMDYSGKDVSYASGLLAVSLGGEIVATQPVIDAIRESSDALLLSNARIAPLENVNLQSNLALSLPLFQIVPYDFRARAAFFKVMRSQGQIPVGIKPPSQFPSGKVCLAWVQIWGYGDVEACSGLTLATKVYKQLLQSQLKAFNGIVAASPTDDLSSVTLVFQNPHQAVLWAMRVQEDVVRLQWPPDILRVGVAQQQKHNGDVIFNGFRLQIGIHFCKTTSEILPESNAVLYKGVQVDAASVLARAARAGEILITHEVYKHIQKQLYLFPNPILNKLGIITVTLNNEQKSVLVYQVYPRSMEARHKYYVANPLLGITVHMEAPPDSPTAATAVSDLGEQDTSRGNTPQGGSLVAEAPTDRPGSFSNTLDVVTGTLSPGENSRETDTPTRAVSFAKRTDVAGAAMANRLQRFAQGNPTEIAAGVRIRDNECNTDDSLTKWEADVTSAGFHRYMKRLIRIKSPQRLAEIIVTMSRDYMTPDQREEFRSCMSDLLGKVNRTGDQHLRSADFDVPPEPTEPEKKSKRKRELLGGTDPTTNERIKRTGSLRNERGSSASGRRSPRLNRANSATRLPSPRRPHSSGRRGSIHSVTSEDEEDEESAHLTDGQPEGLVRHESSTSKRHNRSKSMVASLASQEAAQRRVLSRRGLKDAASVIHTTHDIDMYLERRRISVRKKGLGEAPSVLTDVYNGYSHLVNRSEFTALERARLMEHIRKLEIWCMGVEDTSLQGEEQRAAVAFPEALPKASPQAIQSHVKEAEGRAVAAERQARRLERDSKKSEQAVERLTVQLELAQQQVQASADEARRVRVAYDDLLGLVEKLHRNVRNFFTQLRIYLESQMDETKAPVTDAEVMMRIVQVQRIFMEKEVKGKQNQKDEFKYFSLMALETDQDEEQCRGHPNRLSRSMMGIMNKHFTYMRGVMKRLVHTSRTRSMAPAEGLPTSELPKSKAPAKLVRKQGKGEGDPFD